MPTRGRGGEPLPEGLHPGADVLRVQYDPFLTRALAEELPRAAGEARSVGLLLDRERRAAELRFRELSLVFLLHPEAGFLLRSGPAIAGGGIRLRDLRLARAWAPPDERTLLLSLIDRRGRERARVAVELHTNQWNLLLLEPPATDGAGGAPRVRAALWPRQTRARTLRAGEPYEPPPGGRQWTDRPPTPGEWAALLSAVPPERRRPEAIRRVAWLSPINAAAVLGEALRDDSAEALEEARRRYVRLREEARVDVAAGASPPPGGTAAEAEPRAPGERGLAGAWLLARPYGLQPYPLPLGEEDARPASSLLEAMGEAARSAGLPEFARPPGLGERVGPARLEGEAGAAESPGGLEAATFPAEAEEAVRLREALRRRRRRLRKRRAALRHELEKGPRPEELRSAGNLLLARLKDVPRGARRVTLEDFDGSPRELALDPRLEPAANADRYFKEAARRERALEKVPAAIAAAERELAGVEETLETLARSGPSGELWEAAGGRPAARPAPAAGDGREEERLPYLRLRSSGGLEIRVGRGARANDELTFHHSSPEDIWLHARQVKGAHVVLRWGRKDDSPPRQDLLEAAVAAAVHSGARHSGTVAVDWTRRKYVRKPRKAAPGLVTVERVKTVFVEPDAALVERMKDR